MSPDLKVIFHTGEIKQPDDPSYPFKLEVNLSPPELMQVAFVMLHGGSEILILRGKTREVIDDFVVDHDLHLHPRLRRMTLTGPNGLSETHER